jgi:hypothetical protein
MVVRSALVFRNAAYWDEIETVLDFLLKLHASNSSYDTFSQLFALSNEHRMVTSRLIVAVGYWLTGTVNFNVLSAIGVSFLFGTCAILIATAGTTLRRLQLTVLLAFTLFQLQHFENFFWSGSSIDHFQVVTLAVATLAAAAHGSRGGMFLAGGAAFLATFTLAQGILVWPMVALVLALDRRWRHLGIWGAFALFSLGTFFTGFRTNAGHAIGDFSTAGLWRIGYYWLSALGAPLAQGNRDVAAFLGSVLIVVLCTQLRPGIFARERIALLVTFWAIGALAMVAIGRVDVVQGHVHSRYYVLSCLAWALVVFIQLQIWHDPARPMRALWRVLPVLVGFNIVANVSAAHDARSWTICRDSALDLFLRYGQDGRGRFFLHPIPSYTDSVTRKIEAAGVYRMPELCAPRKFRDPRPSGAILYYVDRLPVTDVLVAVDGWAGVAGRASKPGQIHVILQSAQSRHVFTTLQMPRPDVVAAHPHEKWEYTGFRFQYRRAQLPAEDFQVGILLETEHGSEFTMTAHRVDLRGKGQGILATGK